MKLLRPKNDFYFCNIFHVSKIVSFSLREEKRLLKHFADSRRLPVKAILYGQYADRIKSGLETIWIYEIFDNLTIQPAIRTV